MNATAYFLALSLFSSATSPSAATECPLLDNRCKAERYERSAAAAAAPGPRALYLYNAYVSYFMLYEKAGKLGDLCEAQRTLSASLAVDGQSNDQRAMSERKKAELTALFQEKGARCKGGVKRPHAKMSTSRDDVDRRVAAKTDAPQLRTDAPQLRPVDAPQLRPVADAPQLRVDAQLRPGADAPQLRPVANAPQLRADAPQLQPRPTGQDPSRERSRVRVGVGAGLLVLGGGLLAGTTAALVGRDRFDDKISAVNALAAQQNRPLTTMEMANSTAWDARYVRLEKAGAALGALAAVSVVAAVMVLVLPKRSHSTQARVRPVGAGVLIKF